MQKVTQIILNWHTDLLFLSSGEVTQFPSLFFFSLLQICNPEEKYSPDFNIQSA